MNDKVSPEQIFTEIWEEVPEEDNPFVARECYSVGYDVYGDLLGRASWIEYLYLLFKQEAPTTEQAKLLEGLSIAIANPGPRDQSVQAAMSASAGGSTAASSLMAAIAVGAGRYNGAREVLLFMNQFEEHEYVLEDWVNYLKEVNPDDGQQNIWPEIDCPAGFDPYGVSCTKPVLQTLDHLRQYKAEGALAWLHRNRSELEEAADHPLAMTGVIASAFTDLELPAQAGEMLYLLLRLPGAAAHSLEQYMQWKKLPFHEDGVVLTNDPGSKT